MGHQKYTDEEIRRKLKALFNKATKMVVIVGESTHKSRWVDWEVKTFYDRKRKYPGRTKNRIRALKLKGCHDAILPKSIQDLSIPAMNWDLKTLNDCLITNPTDKKAY